MASSIRSLKVQAGMAATAMFAVGVLAAGILSYGAMSRTLEDAHTQRLLAGTNVGLQALKGVGDRMNVYAEIVARHPDLISTVQRGDAPGLEAFSVQEFKAIHAVDPALATLEITDAKGVVIQRGHNPAKRGDNKSAQPQIRAALEGKSAMGLTVSPTTGEAAEDSVKPIFAGDKIVGTLKVGSYFGHATAEELKERTGFQIVFMYGGKITASTFDKDAQIAVPPETIKAASGGTPATTDFAVADKPYRARLVYLPSDVGRGDDDRFCIRSFAGRGREVGVRLVAWMEMSRSPACHPSACILWRPHSYASAAAACDSYARAGDRKARCGPAGAEPKR